ncbi:hypothetical protein MSG28_004972 [Choristoneura fumiferana]|uniref:Uncharacterized protein n=1 Tax=Choristoneura fumiferana TaxID=7141 RepID=A0ACC0JPC7_CHOFU|nr:hypothetical protein MSG28_004972 [Choristoneura fumiferana]
MMENVDLPPPYSAAVNVSTPSPDVLTTQQEASKQTIDAEPLVPEPLVAHPFDDKFARLAFMQKILLFLLLQALSVLAIMALIANYWYYHQPIYSYVFLCLYLFMLGLLFFSDTARTKHPYKAVLFTAYPIIFAIFISFSTLYSIREMFVAWSCYCVALFALLAYSILIFQTSLEYRPGGGIFISTVVLASLYGALELHRELSNRLREATGNPRAGSFLAQRISIAVQRGNAACVMGTMPRGPPLFFN